VDDLSSRSSRRCAACSPTPPYGTPLQVHADLGFVVNPDPSDRLAAPELGASVLLDMGIYPLTFASYFLGEPEELTAVANITGGVDTSIAIAGRYPGGAMAALTATMTCQSSRMASIATEIGRFDFGRDFHHPASVTWTSYWEPEGVTEIVTPDRPVIGLRLWQRDRRGPALSARRTHRIPDGAQSPDPGDPGADGFPSRSARAGLKHLNCGYDVIGCRCEPKEATSRHCRSPGGGQSPPLGSDRPAQRRKHVAHRSRRPGHRTGAGHAGQQGGLDRLAR
jgi:hypothetical protein